ncbi:MAG: hypothetical protein PHH69_02120 [Candidatus Omnitrophica bacterium]|nr:hypothetical protein [Candidatus Omnitrophota bacterium]MDD5610326.1 hypothetical protein [Candidatus Omnitrophota bacterium]
MKTIIIFLLSITIILTTISIFGQAYAEKGFGQPITEQMVTPIGKILANPGQFAGKIVKIEGKITDECPAGGWFLLKDQTGVIYVDLHSSYFAIPQIRGKQVIAQGVVKKEGSQIEIIGEGVRLK